jgi:hypothetical protein
MKIVTFLTLPLGGLPATSHLHSGVRNFFTVLGQRFVSSIYRIGSVIGEIQQTKS